MKAIKRTFTENIKLTPQEVASIIDDMTSFEMAIFLNTYAQLVKKWDRPFAFHLENLTQEDLEDDARFLMTKFGEYANHNRKA